MTDRHLLVYATTEGQTLKIARFAADVLGRAGAAVEVLPAETAAAEPLDFTSYTRVLLMGSIHRGGFQAALATFAMRNAAALAAAGAGFLAVSLSAAGDDAEDLAGLEDCVRHFTEATGWTPAHVQHVAGAFRFQSYDFFKSLAMRYVARSKGITVDPSTDTEFTDWAALEAFLHIWADVGAAGFAEATGGLGVRRPVPETARG